MDNSLAFSFFFSWVTSFLITYLYIPKIIEFANRFKLYDKKNTRSIHDRKVPAFGGLAIFAGILISCMFWCQMSNIQFFLVGLAMIFFVGLVDDFLDLSPIKKLLGQIFAIYIVIHYSGICINNFHGVLGIYEIPGYVSIPFTIFTFIVITNAYNLIDGIDGLAGGIGIIAAISFSTLSFLAENYNFTIIGLTLVGSLMAFMKYNFFPAKIFMGDTGSLLVGFILSVLAVNTIEAGFVSTNINFPNKGPFLAIGILALPLFDSLRVFMVRLIKYKRNPLSADRRHFHHVIFRINKSQKNTVFTIYFTSIILLVITYCLIDFNVNYAIAILAILSFLILLIPFSYFKYFFNKRKDIDKK